MRVQVVCTLTPDAKKGNPKAAPTTSSSSMSLQQPRVLSQRGAQQPAELDLMARIAGFSLVSRNGGWSEEPFTAESSDHVSVYRLD